MSPERVSRTTQAVGWLAFVVGLAPIAVAGVRGTVPDTRSLLVYGGVALFGALLIDPAAVTRAVRGVRDALWRGQG